MIGLGIMGMPMSANMLKDGIMVYGMAAPGAMLKKSPLGKNSRKGRSIPREVGKRPISCDLSAQRGFFGRCDFRERRPSFRRKERLHRRGNEHLPLEDKLRARETLRKAVS